MTTGFTELRIVRVCDSRCFVHTRHTPPLQDSWRGRRVISEGAINLGRRRPLLRVKTRPGCSRWKLLDEQDIRLRSLGQGSGARIRAQYRRAVSEDRS
jgi:hypothetical protein